MLMLLTKVEVKKKFWKELGSDSFSQDIDYY